jgi:hypothetical protein
MKHLQTHKFRPYKLGNIHKFGLNTFGTKSIISYEEVDGSKDLWMFVWFSNNSDNSSVYVNTQGIRRIFDLGDKNIASRATAMEEDIEPATTTEKAN